MDLKLNGKVALVVASSQGLGRAIAEQLVKEGAHVMITSRNEEKLQQVKQELEQYGMGKVAYHCADITKYEDIKSLVQATREKLGKIDILINNAGGPPGGTFEQLDDEQWQQAFQLNLLSYIRLIREVLPDMKQGGGRIINIASSSVKQPIPGLILSNTFRLGIVGLAKTLSVELAPYNILINTVAPGRIATDRVAHLDEMNAQKQGISKEEVEEKAKQDIPLKRYGEPEEFAKVVTFLVSDASTYITGSTLLVDGGMVKSI
ncbi:MULTISPECIES: SDR family oxidoreductase [Aneurinibacillus]|uniref:3-oxoacyl-[acyl-carrier protein] reductase n=1 Tax=Aneurinibacillus thermoaerophilus TaxID=143495 RepID=A0A1G7WW95_ANETH|nr:MULTISPECIES: SDR family oxidoreductase [Aneurinibacillus]AMA73921.1 3-oxoacyl-ACP reductase [Aneurinibacillus sp. XH2]MED0674105.1 SDR family oxidoreductase [Aneurinibacillus thermoaerophilus]MED0678099.1 SDR family oxidoreductase [Aneurinibacillus thermoaerophilus]MED0737714.1 SDR family oxidoreductase [Aneurinibacillus thermoaerophilus]MED0755706.1 SDR family oxidoreductase [Aneurinibacillus thermoaerophilus]